MTATIHPTAIIGSNVRLGENVSIGAYCVLDGTIHIGDDSILHHHVSIMGNTTIGRNARIFPFAVVGAAPQDLKYKGEPSRLEIGDNVTIREHATLHTGTEGGGMLTSVGNNCLLMVGVHIAHDCRLGNHVIMANNATLAGHVHVGDHAVIGGLAAVHQFVRVGAHAMIGGLSGVENDVIPFAVVIGERAHLSGVNIIGLKRRGFSRDAIHAVRHAVKELFDGRATFAENQQRLAQTYHDSEVVQTILAFLAEATNRSVCQPAAPLGQHDQAA